MKFGKVMGFGRVEKVRRFAIEHSWKRHVGGKADELRLP